jgi:anti-sigma factor RsiW
MTHDQLEFAISQYLDGTLPPEERASIELRLQSDAHARRMLEEYRSLDGLVKQSLPVPGVNWEKLTEVISGAVASDVQSSTHDLTDEEEYAITQYLDGDLASDEIATVETRLANDPAAREVAREHRSLTGLLKWAMPVPAVDYDRLSQEISGAIEEEAARSRYSLRWLQAAPRIAMAACLLLVLGMAFWFYLNNNDTGKVVNQQVAEVVGPAPEQATGAPVAQVVIDMDASEQVARTRYDDYAADVIVAAPSRVQLASSSVQFFEGAAFPY